MPARRVEAARIQAQTAALARAMAGICNDETAAAAAAAAARASAAAAARTTVTGTGLCADNAAATEPRPPAPGSPIPRAPITTASQP